jgi:hypothetical protein
MSRKAAIKRATSTSFRRGTGCRNYVKAALKEQAAEFELTQRYAWLLLESARQDAIRAIRSGELAGELSDLM